MSLKRFYFVVILLSCNCFFLSCEVLCEKIKKIIGIGKNDNNTNIGAKTGETEGINGGEKMEVYKCVIVSAVNCNVGKTNIMNVVKNKKFNESNPYTIAVEYDYYTVKVNNTTIKIQLYDTGSQEKFYSIIAKYLKNSNAVLFVYAINDKKSFEPLEEYIKEARRENTNEDTLFFLLGNKLDLNESRQVKNEDAQTFATQNGLTFLGECSAKTGKYNAASENLDYRNLYELQQSENTNDNKSQLVNILIDITHNIYTKEKSMNG